MTFLFVGLIAVFSGLTQAVTGFGGGFFGIGGPLLVLYYLAVTDRKEAYLGSINAVFSITTVWQLLMRAVNGLMTVQLLPPIAIGIVGILIGRRAGSAIVATHPGGASTWSVLPQARWRSGMGSFMSTNLTMVLATSAGSVRILSTGTKR